MLINFSNGTEILRNGIHINCYTGVLHGIYFPIATLFFFNLLIYIKLSKLIYPIVIFFSYGMYIGQDFLLSIPCVLFYLGIGYISKRILVKPIVSALSIAGCISIMEFIGHWYLESTKSNLGHLLNSIYHTPAYGFQSILLYPHNCAY